MPTNAFGLGEVTWGAVGVWGLLATVLTTLVLTWPVIKQKINEARKAELDADGNLRSTLIERIHQLEEIQSSDRADFFKAMAEERKRCDDELEEIRVRLRQAEDDNRGLMSMIRQASSSTAMIVTNPEAAAVTHAARKARGDEQK